MKKILLIVTLLMMSWVAAQKIQSPDGKFVMNFSLQNGGLPTYQLAYKGKEVIKPSKMGLELKADQPADQSLYSNFEIVDTKTLTFDETWQPVWGEVKNIRNQWRRVI